MSLDKARQRFGELWGGDEVGVGGGGQFNASARYSVLTTR